MGHVRANDNDPQLPTQPQTTLDTHGITGHSDQSADINYGSQSDADPGSPHCHGDIVTRDCEEENEMTSAPYPKNCCRIWCGDDDIAGSEDAVTVATNPPSEKRLHKLGQVYIFTF